MHPKDSPIFPHHPIEYCLDDAALPETSKLLNWRLIRIRIDLRNFMLIGKGYPCYTVAWMVSLCVLIKAHPGTTCAVRNH